MINSNLLVLISNFLSFCETTLGNYYFLFSVILISMIFKLYILIMSVLRTSQTSTLKKAQILLSVVLIGSIFSDLAWVLQLNFTFLTTFIDHCLINFLIRISW